VFKAQYRRRGVAALPPWRRRADAQSTPMNDHALVLFSGGQDSTTCLAWALQRYAQVQTIGFGYGQRHAVEMDCRPRVLAALRAAFPAWAARLGDDQVLDLSLLGQVSDTALTQQRAIELQAGACPTPSCPGATCCS
jgi:7-cyano-7-deazaguanine synthase